MKAADQTEMKTRDGLQSDQSQVISRKLRSIDPGTSTKVKIILLYFLLKKARIKHMFYNFIIINTLKY